MAARLYDFYKDTVRKDLQAKFGYKNVNEIPAITKIVVNMGVGKDAIADRKAMDAASNDLGLITGQKALVTRAKKAIATFKLRQGDAIGCKVTLRKDRMYEFLDRLINAALPRVRDFRGLSEKKFDGMGNYNFGLKEHIIFPEINYDKVDKIRGLDITICTNAKTDEEAKELIAKFNFPFVS